MVVLAEYKNTRIQAETLAAIVAGQLTLAFEANGHATLRWICQRKETR